MIPLAYDLHIHSCLSPCGSDDMTPANIVGMAVVAGLDVIAITDHNSCLNCRAAMKLGATYGITVIPGMELCTREEVHVLCLFHDVDYAEQFSSYIRPSMEQIKNRPDLFGNQLIYNELDDCVGIEEYLLISASNLGFLEVANRLEDYGGIMIPAHIDKHSNSLIAQLGFIPKESTFRCFELRDMNQLHQFRKDYSYLKSCNVISDSDAHQLCDINDPIHTIFARDKSITAILDALIEHDT